MTDGRQRNALVTGGAQRLGRAFVEALAAAGYGVAVHYNASRGPAEALVAELCGKGARAVALGQDLSDSANAGGVVDRAAEALGPLSLLVNSASVYDGDSLRDTTPETWAKLTGVNVLAPVMLMQAFAKQPKVPEGASIVNMLDVQLTAPLPDYFSYFCAKGALEVATRLAAMELAPDIRVNAIAPGLVLPSGGQTEDEFLERQDLTPLKAGLGPDDIVGALMYLAEARHVTGHIVPVDSGQRLMGFGNADVKPLGR